MKKILKFIKDKVVLLLAIAGAAVVGGGAAAVVMAAIPDTNGTIHSCYSNGRGILYIIDGANQSCGAGETGLNWNQHGGPALYDANGQFIGNVLDTPGENMMMPWAVYNPTLNRNILLTYSSTSNNFTIISPHNPVFFESNNCSGQAYTKNGIQENMRVNLIRVGASSYGKVQDNASGQSKTMSSVSYYDYGADSFTCDNSNNHIGSFYEISSVTPPFTTPVAAPFKL